jgi:peptide alpha-N-acetyltransferase
VVATYLNNTGSGCGFISNVCVMPSHSGKGLASRLLTLCKQKTLEAGLSALELEVFAENGPAIKLYEKNGFIHTKQADDLCVMRCVL